MKSTVLVVEDNEALAENMAELFEEAGADVGTCRAAEDALAEARRQEVDLAIVDLRLHGNVDGLSLVPGLKEASPLGEIILVTGNASLDTAIAAVRHGVFAYVLKPFDPEDLLALGERALAQVSLRREREALARDLATSEALYRSVVDSVEALILGLGPNGHITFCNRHACDVVGMDPDGAHGLPLTDLFSEDDAEEMAFQLGRAFRGEVVREREIPLETAGGDARVVRWTLTPLHGGGKGRESILVVGIDVTERLELERKSAENAAMATMGQLTTGLAHEIRNPLNAAKLQLQLLERTAAKVREQPTGDKIRERATIVREEVESLSRMLEEFLSLARPRGMNRKPLDLRALVAEVVELHGPLAAERGIAMESGVPADLGPLDADREKLKQALVNLLANAVDAMEPQGRGEVRVEAQAIGPEWVEVSVTDTGPGLPPEVAAQAFHPFVTTKPAGTGLGLSIVHRTVEQHGGSIIIEPREGGGTVVRFTLPRLQERLRKG